MLHSLIGYHTNWQKPSQKYIRKSAVWRMIRMSSMLLFFSDIINIPSWHRQDDTDNAQPALLMKHMSVDMQRTFTRVCSILIKFLTWVKQKKEKESAIAIFLDHFISLGHNLLKVTQHHKSSLSASSSVLEQYFIGKTQVGFQWNFTEVISTIPS
jgi:hypothetical protein